MMRILWRSWLLVALLGTAVPGQIIIIDPPPHPLPPAHPLPSPERFPLLLESNRIKVLVTDQLATVEMEQLFRNPTARRFQGYYLFPLPEGGVVSNFSMELEGKKLMPELLSAEEARRMYENIVRQMVDPALLEYAGQALLRLKIFPVQPGETRRITLRYQQVLEKDNGTVHITLPLRRAKPATENRTSIVVSIDIHSSAELKNIFCPTHEVEILRSAPDRARIVWEAESACRQRDMQLFFNTTDGTPALSLLSYNDGEEEGYFFLSLSPGDLQKEERAGAKDLTFVVDVSGSMAGEKLQQAKAALADCIRRLNPADRFDLIRFSTGAEALFGTLQPADSAHRAQALQLIEQLRPVGGTNIAEALQLVGQYPGHPGRPHYVVFLTDGKPTVGETDPATIVAALSRDHSPHRRIFTFGIGEEVHTHLLDKIAEITGGHRTYIGPGENIGEKIARFYEKIAFPVLSNLTLQVSPPLRVSDMYPRRIPDLFHGSTVTVLGRYRGSGASRVRVAGFLNGEKREYAYPVTFAGKDQRLDFIPPLWAARAVGYLLDQIRLHGETRERKEEVIALAKAYGIITPYTSYLIVEEEAERVARGGAPDEMLFRFRFGPDDELSHAAVRARAAFSVESGQQSIRTSEEIQKLSETLRVPQANFADTARGEPLRPAETVVRRVSGRTFYRVGAFWVEAAVAAMPHAPVVRIRFAGEPYFELLRKKPHLAELLSLGKNLRFLLDGKIYEISM